MGPAETSSWGLGGGSIAGDHKVEIRGLAADRAIPDPASRHPARCIAHDLVGVDQNRVVLGICYGNQMVARALVDDGACRQAAIPEYGFKNVALVPNPLFSGIGTLSPVHAHNDEVTGLPEDRFEVIASTDHCEVQAWQLRGRTVWGVQFHPELDERLGRQLLDRCLETEEGAREVYVNELEDPAHIEAGRRLFENFFQTPPVEVNS